MSNESNLLMTTTVDQVSIHVRSLKSGRIRRDYVQAILYIVYERYQKLVEVLCYDYTSE